MQRRSYPGGHPLDRLRRRDPGLHTIRRGARLTLVASLVFFVCRYGIANPVLATYALFGTVATGAFARLPGRPAERARTLLAALPVAWILVAAGTFLAVDTWAAAAGMLVVGFVVAFAGVGGPRLIGLTNALQLFYILACFPPYQPDTLVARLGGVTLGILLVALAEATLWPDPTAGGAFLRRLGEAADRLADLMDGIADGLLGRAGADQVTARRRDAAVQAAERARLSHLPATERPTSARRRDRALRDAAAGVRQMLALTESLAADTAAGRARDDDLAWLLRRCAGSVRRSCHPASPAAPEPAADVAVADAGDRPAGLPADAARLRRDGTARMLAEQVDDFGTAVRIAAGVPARPDGTRPEPGPDQFWYARRGTLSLYWRQSRAHLTPRSVYFEGAVRLAVALAAARVVAGTVNLQHGFWVLLATLSLMRASAADTRMTLRPALSGTLAGAGAGGLLILASPVPADYAVLLPLIMLLAFGVGPLLGLGWSQALLTVLLIVVFAQLSPANWQLVEARVVDVAIGGAIGVLAGLLLWPRGGSGELRRDAGAYLAAGGRAVEETLRALAGTGDARGAVRAARRARVLADASFAQYHAERHDPRMSHVDWDAVLSTGGRMFHGSEVLLSHHRPGVLAPWPDATAHLVGWAQRLRSGYLELARQVSRGRIDRPAAIALPATPDVFGQVHAIVRGGETRPEVLRLVEVAVWLAELTHHLDRIRSAAEHPGR